ncbi:hypothetical protein NS365_12325 [Aureimonas ureilytica]|uniref:Uncharacterized protein n=1 Tax=Aureimonas ureilytica TaxID=401562 RepID=A0A175RPE4_9HYPH|nr:hypothetical protein NS365_12325 [Aureimonas ureilytica]
MQDALPMALDPPFAQKSQRFGGQHGVGVAPALAALDAQQHPRGIDVADLHGKGDRWQTVHRTDRHPGG